MGPHSESAIILGMTKKEPTAPTLHGFGRRIREVRKAAGYTQLGLLKALGWPHDTNSRMSGYENEEREPSLPDFIAIAAMCNADPAYVMFGKYRLEALDARIIQSYHNAPDEVQRIIRAALHIEAQDDQQAG